MSRRLALSLASLSLLAAGCSSKDSAPAGTAQAAEELVFETDDFTVAAGKEKYMCFAKTLEEDLTFDRVAYDETAGIHHFLFARTMAPEREGMVDCGDQLIKFTWAPLFGTGKSSASLETPPGAAYSLKKGEQVLVQLHLLNATQEDITDRGRLRLRKSTTASPNGVGIYAFGTGVFSLPPRQEIDVHNECAPEHDVDLFALLPHMHKLGKQITFQVGTSAEDAKTVFQTDGWTFDSQYIAPEPIHIPKGAYTRTICHYDNTRDQTVGFGESSNDEMCYLVGFAVGGGAQVDGCVNMPDDSDGGTGPSPDAGVCGMTPANAKGIGATCTKGGGECGPGLTCSLDQDPTPPGFCMSIGACQTTADCGGGGATCCAPKQGGGLINICVPEACRPADCSPKP